jgi:hypothetical protein
LGKLGGMGIRNTAEILKKERRRRKTVWDFLTPAIGIALGVALTIGAWFVLYHVKARACPPTTIIFGSTRLGSLLAILPWFFVGLSAGCTFMGFIFYRLPWTGAKRAAGGSSTYRISMRLGTAATALFLILAIALSSFGVFTGFCAGPDGISYQKSPWSESTIYKWNDVRRVAVVCYSQGRRSYASFTLSMDDGAKIDLYDMPRSFNTGYPSTRKMLQQVPLVYDDSLVLANCNSTLRDILRP